MTPSVTGVTSSLYNCVICYCVTTASAYTYSGSLNLKQNGVDTLVVTSGCTDCLLRTLPTSIVPKSWKHVHSSSGMSAPLGPHCHPSPPRRKARREAPNPARENEGRSVCVTGTSVGAIKTAVWPVILESGALHEAEHGGRQNKQTKANQGVENRSRRNVVIWKTSSVLLIRSNRVEMWLPQLFMQLRIARYSSQSTSFELALSKVQTLVPCGPTNKFFCLQLSMMREDPLTCATTSRLWLYSSLHQ